MSLTVDFTVKLTLDAEQPYGVLNAIVAMSASTRSRARSSANGEVARQTRSLQELLDIIRSHHERMDGRGYPDGLAGEDIPLAARIVAVADVWDAVTSDRSYRTAWSVDKALEIMIEGRGSQFDARCLDEFLRLLEEQGIAVSSVGRQAS